jgi:hypothetical protein
MKLPSSAALGFMLRRREGPLRTLQTSRLNTLVLTHDLRVIAAAHIDIAAHEDATSGTPASDVHSRSK